MNELTRFGALSARRTEAALLRGNAVTERFGLTLTPEQCGRLLARRASALRETERIEPGEGILPKLAVALCDSPCVGPENWEEALGGAARPPARRWKISEQLRPRGRRPRRKPARLRRSAGSVRMKEKGHGRFSAAAPVPCKKVCAYANR